MNIYTIAQKYKDKIWTKVDRSQGNFKCWEWKARKTNKGYGRYAVYPNKAEYAHRLVWVLCGNLIPPGLVLDHICKNRGCVNPNHLRLVTIGQNTLENSDSSPAKNIKKTHCIRGHKLSIKYKSGRKCKECQVEAHKKRTRVINGKIYPVSARGKDAESFFNDLLK